MLRIGALDATRVSGRRRWSAAAIASRAGSCSCARRCDDAPEPPVWPPGYALRPFRRDADARAVHAAFADGFADHFGPPFDPYDPWFHKLFVQPALPFRDDLMLVAWRGDEVAGALVAAETAAETAAGGYVAELAVRRAHRKQGLGRALLLESFARLRDLGRTEVLLHVDADSETNATGLYRGVGMREQPMYAYLAEAGRLAGPVGGALAARPHERVPRRPADGRSGERLGRAGPDAVEHQVDVAAPDGRAPARASRPPAWWW